VSRLCSRTDNLDVCWYFRIFLLARNARYSVGDEEIFDIIAQVGSGSDGKNIQPIKAGFLIVVRFQNLEINGLQLHLRQA
jgi:hypothetical protein